MCTILLSINPEHVGNIMCGKKNVEYRKTRCRHQVDRIVIYSTYPIMRVVGEATVEAVMEDEPALIWAQTSEMAGITKEYFDKYFENRCKAIAYRLGKITKYERTYSLSEMGIRSAPQSFMYIS